MAWPGFSVRAIVRWQQEAENTSQRSTTCIWSNLRSGELNKAAVFGVYTAVQYADPLMLHRLAGLSSVLMTDEHMQVVCSLHPTYLSVAFVSVSMFLPMNRYKDAEDLLSDS